MKQVYLDNAATTFPKAPTVSRAICDYIDNVGTNVGRGTYQSSYSAGQVVYETRELLCRLFNFDNPLNVVFTMNITNSFNMILKGLLQPGDHVIVSSMEHNAVMRPLSTLKKTGVEFTRVLCSTEGYLNPEEIEKNIMPNTRAVIMTHASNVCGTVMPVEDVGLICKKHGIYFILDSAQSAGVLDVDFKKFNLDCLAFTGHKGLLGPQGIGGFLVTDELANSISSMVEGGTGSMSESEEQPDYMPDKFESGTLNLPGIYGLNASLKYISDIGIKNICKHETALTEHFIDGLLKMDFIEIIGLKTAKDRTSVVSIDFKDIDNSEAAYMLDREYAIMTRVGLHCAPSAHKTLGTFPRGTVRFSFGYFNTVDEVNYTIESIYDMFKKMNSNK